MSGVVAQRWFDRLGPELERHYDGAGPCHDLTHVARVALLTERIADAEGVSIDAAVLSGLLHDAGHAASLRAGTDDHHVQSAEIARTLLGPIVAADVVDEVVDAVGGRRFAARAEPRGAVAAVLDDADNLDAIGLVGVSRAYLYIGQHGWAEGPARSLDVLAGRNALGLRSHWEEKLRHLEEGMRTATGRALARARGASLERYISASEEELADVRS